MLRFLALSSILQADFCPSYYEDSNAESGCWTAAEVDCDLANTACTNLVCGNNGQMTAALRPDLFGLSEEDAEDFVEGGDKKLKLNDESCPIYYDVGEGVFMFNQAITACGSTVKEVTEGEGDGAKEYFTFTHSFVQEKLSILDGIIVANEVNVHLQCRYSRTITISSDQYELKKKTAKAIVLQVEVPTTITHSDFLKIDSDRYRKAENTLLNQLKQYWPSTPIPTFEIIFQMPGRRRRAESAQYFNVVIKVVFPVSMDPNYGATEDEMKELAYQFLAALRDIYNTGLSLLEEPIIVIDDVLREVEERDIEEKIAKGTVVGYGDMTSQFSLDLYDSDAFDKPIDDIVMGQTIYAKTHWSSPIDDISYLVNNCKYSCSETREPFVEIVKNTCYAMVLRTVLTNPSGVKKVIQDSHFSVQSFVFQGEDSNTDACIIECQIKTCVTFMPCGIPETCPAGMDYMKYTLTGQ